MLLREDGHRVGPDLVGHVAVGGDAVRPHHHRVDLAPGHQVARHVVGDEGRGDPVLQQLPRGEPRALEPGPRLVREDALHLAEPDGGADDAECRAVAGGGERAGVAVGEDARLVGQELRSEVAHAAARREVLPLDGEGLVEEAAAERLAAGGLEGAEALPHPLDGPEEVDRGGPGRGERRAHVAPLGLEEGALAAGGAQAEGEAERGGDADRGSAADRHVLDGGRDLVVVAATQDDLFRRQAPLVDHDHDAVLPRDRRDHAHLLREHRSPCLPEWQAAAGLQSCPAMIPVEEALEIVLREANALPAVEVALHDALSRVLAEDVASDLDLPPFDRSAMDGYALRAEDVASAPAALDVVGEVRAGQWPDLGVGPGQAVRIMTGAPLPRGADSVQQVEKTQPLDEFRVTILSPVAPGAHVAPRGSEVRAGDVVLARGRVIDPAAIAVLASAGRSRVRVAQATRRRAARHRRRDRGRVLDSCPRPDPQQQRARALRPLSARRGGGASPRGRSRPAGRDRGVARRRARRRRAPRLRRRLGRRLRPRGAGPPGARGDVSLHEGGGQAGGTPRLRAAVRHAGLRPSGQPRLGPGDLRPVRAAGAPQDAGSARRLAAPPGGGARRRRQEPFRPQELPARARALARADGSSRGR